MEEQEGNILFKEHKFSLEKNKILAYNNIQEIEYNEKP
jgi:hypothetical protein